MGSRIVRRAELKPGRTDDRCLLREAQAGVTRRQNLQKRVLSLQDLALAAQLKRRHRSALDPQVFFDRYGHRPDVRAVDDPRPFP